MGAVLLHCAVFCTAWNLLAQSALRADPLYILDDAFYQVLEPLFRLVVQDFDMFEDTVIDKFQWKKIRELDIEAYVKADFVQETAGMLAEIDQWVTAHIPDGGAFLVIGV